MVQRVRSAPERTRKRPRLVPTKRITFWRTPGKLRLGDAHATAGSLGARGGLGQQPTSGELVRGPGHPDPSSPESGLPGPPRLFPLRGHRLERRISLAPIPKVSNRHHALHSAHRRPRLDVAHASQPSRCAPPHLRRRRRLAPPPRLPGERSLPGQAGCNAVSSERARESDPANRRWPECDLRAAVCVPRLRPARGPLAPTAGSRAVARGCARGSPHRCAH